MREVSAARSTPPKYRPGLPLRLGIILAAFIAEKVFLNLFVDFARANAAQGLGAFVRDLQHWGFRFLVALVAAIALFAYVREGQTLVLAKAAIRASPVRLRWMLGHFLLVACLVPLTTLMFRTESPALPYALLLGLWAVFALGAVLSAFLTMSTWPLWLDAARGLGAIWRYAIIAALLGASAMQLSQRLWAPTTAITFDLVRLVLLPVMPSLRADAATRVLSTDHFAVEISEICSGLEGMGLILAFTTAWLLYFRREYIFPRALLLIPVGLLMIFSLNILRIAALMLIGDAGFPDIAEYGFHSQAGWIAFNAVACGLVYFSRNSRWLSKTSATIDRRQTTENPTATYLMPLLAVLAAGVLSRALSGGFEVLFALRLFAGAGFLAVYRRRLIALDWHWSWRGPVVGLLVFMIWIFAANFLVPQAPMPEPLAIHSLTFRGIWIAGRLAVSILLVPIAEELAYRGYLMRRLVSPDFEAVQYQSVGLFSIAATALVFGFAHGAMWLPGIAAGLAYAVLVVRRGTLGEAVVAHATTNALVAIAVLIGGQWQLW